MVSLVLQKRKKKYAAVRLSVSNKYQLYLFIFPFSSQKLALL